MDTCAQENQIRLCENDVFESEVLTFATPKLSGWLKKRSSGVFVEWKRHWFVLANGVLYYFFTPQDNTPRCIIPLEKITVHALGPTDLIVTATKGLVKSAKVIENGCMQQGSHKEFILRADSESYRDLWLKELRNEVMNPFMKNTRTGTPGHLSFQSQLASNIPLPRFRGWAMTQNNQDGGPWTRRYCAIFNGTIEHTENPHDDNGPSVIYFFGSSEMCDRMVHQKVYTSHGAINLNDITIVHLRTLISGVNKHKAIIMYTYSNQDGPLVARKQWVFVPEDKYEDWLKILIECCPKCGVPSREDDPLQVETMDMEDYLMS